MLIRNKDIPWGPTESLARIGASTGFCTIPVSARYRKYRVATADARESGRHIGHAMGNEMDDLTLPLDLTVNRDHARRQNDTPLFFVEIWPNDEIGALPRLKCSRGVTCCLT
ncbi:hypothetical protein [Acidiphilium acidophilum]|uniref:Uncharacterized protein n=1 Tax=Acidiphilium acidophilum TaxID=76588 RepID=A0AAW9DWQ4_ACIAO|nr:hypothetical protein [Acidiphilium acidophilum]MDX5933031.1 hypothetical protein [Acidiphilium acidophilum]GBQ11284.1 hypothetical protein AA700_1040 [Acidiphilium acidophilum DSM 700]